jgi:hypothetical protein
MPEKAIAEIINTMREAAPIIRQVQIFTNIASSGEKRT